MFNKAKSLNLKTPSPFFVCMEYNVHLRNIFALCDIFTTKYAVNARDP